MSEQRVIFKINSDGNMAIDFDPMLIGEGSDSYDEQSEDEKLVQRFADGIAGELLELVSDRTESK